VVSEDEGYEVITAVSGREAVRKITVETPDLLLLDMVMPGMSGLEVCKILKSDPKTNKPSKLLHLS
jgi:CheY-like chemotaxis protein